MTPAKRLFDIVLAVAGGLLLSPLIAVVALVVLVGSGWPIFYVSERMRAPGQPFQLWKFRTMVHGSAGGVTGGDKVARITRVGRVLRRTRLDELPQIWNVLRGDISFVGPRPPLRIYVEDYPDLYRKVLAARPGITGLASLTFHAHEENLLGACYTVTETDQTYRRRCIPRKAALDLIYLENRSVCFDIRILVATLARALGVGRRSVSRYVR